MLSANEIQAARDLAAELWKVPGGDVVASKVISRIADGEDAPLLSVIAEGKATLGWDERLHPRDRRGEFSHESNVGVDTAGLETVTQAVRGIALRIGPRGDRFEKVKIEQPDTRGRGRLSAVWSIMTHATKLAAAQDDLHRAPTERRKQNLVTKAIRDARAAINTNITQVQNSRLLSDEQRSHALALLHEALRAVGE